LNQLAAASVIKLVDLVLVQFEIEEVVVDPVWVQDVNVEDGNDRSDEELSVGWVLEVHHGLEAHDLQRVEHAEHVHQTCRQEEVYRCLSRNHSVHRVCYFLLVRG